MCLHFSSLDFVNSSDFARVEISIKPQCPGRVKFEGSYWDAEFHDPEYQNTVHPGTLVKVLDRQNITLKVMPVTISKN